MKINELKKEDRPRERLINKGPESLSDVELLAIILGSGSKNKDVLDISNTILNKYSFYDLKDLSYQELIKLNGIKQAKACKLLACFEISKRSFKKNDMVYSLDNSKKIFEYLYDSFYLASKEKIVVVFMSIKLVPIKKKVYDLGNSHSIELPIRNIVESCIKTGCSCIVIAHNHPSGDLEPSLSDIDTTVKLKNILEDLNIILIDHLIIGDNKYYSFNDNGLFIEEYE